MNNSVVGVKAHWCCAICSARENTHQFVYAGERPMLNPPPGWAVIRQASYCGAHRLEGERIAAAAAPAGVFLVPGAA